MATRSLPVWAMPRMQAYLQDHQPWAALGQEQYLQLHPDIVTMDIVMPKRSGIDAVKRIREQAPDACVVMCSALGQETLVMEALQAGARDFIVKPFKPENVIDTLQKVLEKNEG